MVLTNSGTWHCRSLSFYYSQCSVAYMYAVGHVPDHPLPNARTLMGSRSAGHQHRRSQNESRRVSFNVFCCTPADNFTNNCRYKPTGDSRRTCSAGVRGRFNKNACLPACMLPAWTVVSRYMGGVLTMSELPLFREPPDVCRLAAGVLNTSGLLKCNQ